MIVLAVFLLGSIWGGVCMAIYLNRQMDECADWCQWTHCALRQMKARLEAAQQEQLIAEVQEMVATDEDDWKL